MQLVVGLVLVWEEIKSRNHERGNSTSHRERRALRRMNITVLPIYGDAVQDSTAVHAAKAVPGKGRGRGAESWTETDLANDIVAATPSRAAPLVGRLEAIAWFVLDLLAVSGSS